MRISLSWLSEYLDFTEKNPQRIAEVLTEKIAEVDAIESSLEKYSSIVTGKLLSFEKIPGSDKLHAGKFDIGKEAPVSVVFGSVFPLETGGIYPISLPGTKLANGAEVKLSKMMGVETEGMVTSEEEMGTSFTSEGFIRCGEKTALGKPILEILAEALENVVIGEILEITKHPNADKLNITKVRMGENTVNEIVCGGSNLRVGAKVPVALPGANLWWEIQIKASKIRDVESQGMVCSTEELKVGPSQNKEIYILPQDSIVGTPFFDYCIPHDAIFVIENTVITNRPDLFSQVGFARELAAAGIASWKKSWTEIEQSLEDWKKENIPDTDLPIEIHIPNDETIAPRYLAVSVENVDGSIKSPKWLADRLEACGVRSLSALVDITNYLMLEYGTPNHAFDRARTGQKWTMRLSKEGETMETLDGVTRKLTDETIVFEDEENGIFDLCGVMGGEVSGIAQTTKSILSHFPVYDPVKVRRTALRVGPRTDAAGIYEKTVPAHMAYLGIIRGLQLLKEIFPEAKISSRIFDQVNKKEAKRVISLPLSLVSRIAGREISSEESVKILRDIGVAVEEKGNGILECIPPLWRLKDISIPEDLVEEILRLTGVDTMLPAAPQMTMGAPAVLPIKKLERGIADILVKNGFYEILTLAFLGETLLTKAGMKKTETMIELKNPLSEDMSIMRTSLTPQLLEVAERNIRERKKFRIFESGNVYEMENNEKTEKARITGLLVGDDFLTAKGMAEEIVESFGWHARVARWEENRPPFAHPGQSALMRIGKNGIIKIFSLHPQIAKKFDLPASSIICMNLQPLLEMGDQAKKINALPKYQEIPFDFSVVCDRKTAAADILSGLTKLDPRIESVKVLDVFEGKGVSEGQKSVTLSCEFRAVDRTLTDEERDELFQILLKELETRGVKFRFGE